MPSQLEKVILNTHPLRSQHIRKHRAQHLFLRRSRRNVGIRCCLRLRQRLPVQLAVGRQRQLFHNHERRRHHVLRQTLLHPTPQHRCIQLNSSCHCWYNIGHQLFASRMVLPHHHRRLPHSRFPPQCRFYLSQLNAEPTYLYLLVRSSPMLQHSFSSPSSPDPPCGTCALPAPSHTRSARKRSAVNPGRFK